MKEYQNKVVAITGAAQGIGREIAMQLAEKGAKLSLQDIKEEHLTELTDQLKAKGAEFITSCFDVADFDAMQEFARKTFATFGAVDYVFSNAGVSQVGIVWKMPLEDYDWVMDVNAKGCLHAIKAFIPEMINQDKECYFITTASAAALFTAWGGATYSASKHAALALMESLEQDLRKENTKVKSYIITPSVVISNLHNSSESRLQTWDKEDPAYQDPEYKEAVERSNQYTSTLGMPTDEAVKKILKAIDEDKFLIQTHETVIERARLRSENLLSGKRPNILSANRPEEIKK